MTDTLQDRLPAATSRVVEAVLGIWPEHGKLVRSSFGPRSPDQLRITEEIAIALLAVAADRQRSVESFAADYRYFCDEIFFPEEVFFQREGRYRLSTFAEAAREVYDNKELMARYMDGLLVSYVLWLHHACAINDFANLYLPSLSPRGAHLEIGPGHGMLLNLAIQSGRFESHAAWDVSATSVEHTGRMLETLGRRDQVDLSLMDIFAPAAVRPNRARFSTIVFSEVLEHLERPEEALDVVADLLTPGGSVWINIPANAPAPDHLFLIRSLDEATDLVRRSGLVVKRSAAYPVAGASLERAVRQSLPVSCVVVGEKARP